MEKPFRRWLRAGLRGAGGFGWVLQLNSHRSRTTKNGNAATTQLEPTCRGKACKPANERDRVSAKRRFNDNRVEMSRVFSWQL